MKKKYKIFIIIIIAILILASLFTITIIKKKIKDKTVNIGFYGVSSQMCQMLKDIMPVEENIILNFTEITPEKISIPDISKKYDILFTWKGEITDALSENAEKMPKNYLDQIPKSLRDEKILPILLDNYELDFKSSVAKEINTNILENYDAFIDYMRESSKLVFSPFFMNAGDDRMLFAFLGNVVEANGGASAYNQFINELKKTENLDSILDISLNENKSLTFRSVLDSIKTWPKEGFTHPLWYMANQDDVKYFSESNQVAVFYTSLSNHREYEYNFIKEYVSTTIPKSPDSADHGIIAPELCVMLLSNNSNAKRYVKEYISVENQEVFSTKTMLAPVQYTAQAFDKQADDVRFWAASCSSGALPDPYLAAFQTNPGKMEKLAVEIRSYLKK